MPRYGRSTDDTAVASQLAALKRNPEFTAAMEVLLEARPGEAYEDRLIRVLNLLFEEVLKPEGRPTGKAPKGRKARTRRQ